MAMKGDNSHWQAGMLPGLGDAAPSIPAKEPKILQWSEVLLCRWVIIKYLEATISATMTDGCTGILQARLIPKTAQLVSDIGRIGTGFLAPGVGLPESHCTETTRTQLLSREG